MTRPAWLRNWACWDRWPVLAGTAWDTCLPEGGVPSLDATQAKSFRVAESQLRQKVLRAFSALLVTAASLLLFLFLPLLPRELMVFVAIGLGALAYRVPTLALVLMVLLAVP